MYRFPVGSGHTFEIPPRFVVGPLAKLSTPAMPGQGRALAQAVIDFLFPVAVALALVLAFISF